MTSLIGLRRFLDRRRAAVRDDAGFSLLEAVIALVIAGGVFSSLSVALLQTVRSGVQARQSQNAADLLNKQVEYVRSLDFSAATELTSDLAGDSNLSYSSGTYYLTTSAGQEPVVAGTVGLLPQHIQTVVQQNTTYTLKTYITQVADTVNASANYRRVTVIAQWTINGILHTRKTSSFFTDTRRGLPLPRFTMGTAGTYKTNVGAKLALPIKITNVGAPDAFNLTASAPPSGSWSWYYDSGATPDGVWTSTDAPLTDTDGDGVPDTGLLQVNGSILIFAVRTVGTGEPTTQTVTFTATSSAQPTASTASQGFSDQVLVNPASCSSCTLTTYFLHNSSTYGATVYQSTSGNNTPMSMDKTAPASTRLNLYDYATDCSSLAGAADCASLPYGRHIRVGGAPAETDRTKVAAWYYSVPTATTIAGTASLTLWVRAADGTGSATSLTVYVGSDTNNSISGSWSQAGSTTVSVPATTTPGWQAITVGIPISGTLSINQNKYLGVRVVTNGALNIRTAYDTTTYNAQAVFPVVSGG